MIVCVFWVSCDWAKPPGGKKPFNFIVSGINAPNYFPWHPILFHWERKAGTTGWSHDIKTLRGNRATTGNVTLHLWIWPEFNTHFLIKYVKGSISLLHEMCQCTYSATPASQDPSGIHHLLGRCQSGPGKTCRSSHVPVGLVRALEICFTKRQK